MEGHDLPLGPSPCWYPLPPRQVEQNPLQGYPLPPRQVEQNPLQGENDDMMMYKSICGIASVSNLAIKQHFFCRCERSHAFCSS